jgi:hypothetical protein
MRSDLRRYLHFGFFRGLLTRGRGLGRAVGDGWMYGDLSVGEGDVSGCGGCLCENILVGEVGMRVRLLARWFRRLLLFLPLIMGCLNSPSWVPGGNCSSIPLIVAVSGPVVIML